MMHTAVVLPQGLIAHLKADGEKAGRGLSAEIRQRLAILQDDDPETQKLIEFIKTLADKSAGYFDKKWHEREYAKAAFVGGILKYFGPLSTERDIPGHTDNPEAVGRTLAGLILAARRGAPKHNDEQ
jgi:hypothetical protein